MKNYYQDKWDALEKEVDKRSGNGREVASALKDLYTVYDTGVLAWLAKLYDPKVGGFYYSNSGRDTETVTVNGESFYLLPDIESTKQAVCFLAGHRVIENYSDLPEKMREQMYKFFSSCLDPETGFFYHPQWSKELTDSKPSRRGRDLRWAEELAESMGWKYPYPTANERLSGAKTGDEESVVNIPEYMRTKEKLIEYLDSLDFENRPYPSGNTVSAQARPIKAAGLSEVVVEYLNAIQDKESGFWGNNAGYDAINGYMKITSFYIQSGFPIPNAEKAVSTIVKTILSSEPAPHVCCQYNCWFSIQSIFESLRKFGGKEGQRKAEEIAVSLLKIAPEAIKATKEKVLTFRKDDYSFSWYPEKTSAQSQGMNVAVSGSNEGDVNATTICSSLGRMYAAFGLRDFAVPLFSRDAYKLFLENLKLD